MEPSPLLSSLLQVVLLSILALIGGFSSVVALVRLQVT
jgi:hypothetical protein